MNRSAWLVFGCGWLATLAAGYFAPQTFAGLVALALDVVAVACLGWFAVLLRAESPLRVGRRWLGTAVVVAGGVLWSLVADFGVGLRFAGRGSQPADIKRFGSLGDALLHVFSEPILVLLCLCAAATIAFGAWLRSGASGRQILMLFLASVAVYPAIVWKLCWS